MNNKLKIKHLAKRMHPAQIPALVRYLLRDEAISGRLIIGSTVLALLAVNTALGSFYDELWQTKFTIGVGDWSIAKDFRHWINEALMALFFLVVGLELKRELVQGELRKFKTAILPFAAAIGGMIIPASVYLAFNANSDSSSGWAVPMATDIAFAIGILALLGRRIPSSVRLFLLTLAIVDDIGAVIVIAIFYSAGINLGLLSLAVALAVALILLRRSKLLTMPVFVITAILLWGVIDASGVHASIAGALIGLLAPITLHPIRQKSIAERLERFAIPISTLIVVPLFAFANTGVVLSLASFQGDDAAPIAAGIILGLIVGKVAGIVGASWLMVRLGYAELPLGANWNHIIGVGFLAGIGFTVAIFVTELAFMDENHIIIAKISIFAASILSALVGLLVLRRIHHHKHISPTQ